MKRTYKHIFITCLVGALSTLAVSSCREAETSDQSFEDGEIVLRVDDRFIVDTKATDISEGIIDFPHKDYTPSFCVMATTTEHDIEKEKWTLDNAILFNEQIATGHYWDNQTYNFYVANETISARQTVSVTLPLNGSETLDVVVGKVTDVNSGTPNIVLRHILSRITGFSITTKAGFELTNVSITLLSGLTHGLYDLKNMMYVASTDSDSNDFELLSVPSMEPSQTYEYECNHYFIPKTYTLILSYQMGRDIKRYSATVTLEEGNAYNINAEIGENGTEIQITATLAPWTRTTTQVTQGHDFPSFGGVNIAPGPLLYTGGKMNKSYVIQPSWKIGCEIERKGSIGSGYLQYEKLGKFFSSQEEEFWFDAFSGGIDIDNLGYNVTYEGYDDWRIPTADEYYTILDGPRAGSTVNGISEYRFAFVEVTGYVENICGLLLFPDEKTFTIQGINLIKNVGDVIQRISISSLDALVHNGCAFLPALGMANPISTGKIDVGTACYYHCATLPEFLDRPAINCLYAGPLFGGTDITVSVEALTDYPATNYMPVRLVRNAE